MTITVTPATAVTNGEMPAPRGASKKKADSPFESQLAGQLLLLMGMFSQAHAKGEEKKIAGNALPALESADKQGEGTQLLVNGGLTPVLSTVMKPALNNAATNNGADLLGRGQQTLVALEKTGMMANPRDSIQALVPETLPPLMSLGSELSSFSALPLLPESVGKQSLFTPAPQAFVASLPVPLHSPEWTTVLSKQLLTLAKINGTTVSIEVTPRELGPIEVNLQLNEKVAQISFTASHPATREMLENQLPRLVEMLAAGGIELADTHFSDAKGQPSQTFSTHYPLGCEVIERDTPNETLATVQASREILSVFV